jgi:hypothetical protein
MQARCLLLIAEARACARSVWRRRQEARPHAFLVQEAPAIAVLEEDLKSGSAVPPQCKVGRHQDHHREREWPFASRFALCVNVVLGMKTSAGSLNRVLNFRTCPNVRLRSPVMNIETALSDPNWGMRSR